MIVPLTPLWIVRQVGPGTEIYAIGNHDVDRRHACVALLGSLNWPEIAKGTPIDPPTIDIIANNHGEQIGILIRVFDAQDAFDALATRLNIMFEHVAFALNPLQLYAVTQLRRKG